MDTSKSSKTFFRLTEDEDSRDDEFQAILQTLPKEENCWTGDSLYFYQGFWCPSLQLKAIISFQKHFQALDDDIILVTSPKCGTTWLKALIFAIVNRNEFPLKKTNHPLLSFNPHQLVPFFEVNLYSENPSPDLESISRPRIFSTHTPYASLPTSIKDSNCKMVYICRNPMDVFISGWIFSNNLRPENIEPLSLDKAFEKSCQGLCNYGPFWDHVLGFWKASQENPNKILFLKYEDLKEEIIWYTKKVADFLGFPFSQEEEKQGMVEEIAKLCSLDNLKRLEVNKSGNLDGIPKNSFFREGKVGDWSNYLTPSMAKRLESHVRDKLANSGLTFDYFPARNP